MVTGYRKPDEKEMRGETMNFRIVTDSSSNVLSRPGENFACVPMKIVAGQEYVDVPGLNLTQMVEDLKVYKGKSGSSCPNVGEWLEAFGDAEYVFGITITKHLSGSYNAARQAADTYMEEHPDRRVYLFDSLSAGPELMMIADKIRQCEADGDDFDTTIAKVLDYHNHTHTIFCLESMNNLAHNGRVPLTVAKLAGLLGIRVIGEAHGGQIVAIHKPRGAKKALHAMVQTVKERGFRDGGLIRVAHCFAEDVSQEFMALIREEFPHTRFILEPTSALCSYYAEVGGYIVGFEGDFNAHNDNSKF